MESMRNTWKTVKVKIKLKSVFAEFPQYATPGAACMDISVLRSHALAPGESALLPTGICMEIPPGYELQLRPRSGLSRERPGYLVNSPATIDSDYRGEILVPVKNTSDKEWLISRGDRIVQGKIAEVPSVILTLANELSETKRGDGGFGHTGRNKYLR